MAAVLGGRSGGEPRRHHGLARQTNAAPRLCRRPHRADDRGGVRPAPPGGRRRGARAAPTEPQVDTTADDDARLRARSRSRSTSPRCARSRRRPTPTTTPRLGMRWSAGAAGDPASGAGLRAGRGGGRAAAAAAAARPRRRPAAARGRRSRRACLRWRSRSPSRRSPRSSPRPSRPSRRAARRRASPPRASPLPAGAWVIQLGAMDDEAQGASDILDEARQPLAPAPSPRPRPSPRRSCATARRSTGPASRASTKPIRRRRPASPLKRNGFACFATRS